MFQRDYFMRLIEQAAEAAGHVLGLRKKKELAEAQRFIDDWFERNLRIRPDLVDKLRTDDLVRLHTIGGIVDVGALQAAARMIRESADIREEAEGEGAGFVRRVKALCLHLKLAELAPDPALEDHAAAADSLLAKLEAYELPAEAVRAVAARREQEGRYAEAENGLYELYERGEADAGELAAFYERLMKLPDDMLEAGGLPRAEIETDYAGLTGINIRTGRTT